MWLVTEYDNWLVHIVRVNCVNYLIYTDRAHSIPIEDVTERIYVNWEWKLIVDIKWKEVIIQKQDKK